jgi:hypothetical protein
VRRTRKDGRTVWKSCMMVFDVSVKIVKLRSSKWIIKLTSTWNDLRADVNVKWFESWCQSEAFESWRQREQTWKLTSTSPNFRAGVTLKGFKSWCNRDRIWEVTSTCKDLIDWFDLIFDLQQYFSYIMVTSFSGGRSRSTQREPPTMGKQLVNFITYGCESSAPFL